MTFTRTYEVVDEAVAAGYFPPRHPVTITAIEELATGVVRMAFKDPYIAEHARPAQFVNLFTHDEMMLMPRPFGVSEVVGDEVSVIFAVVGKGTANLAAKHVGDNVDVLGPLGMRPFQIKNKAHYVLVAGGLGVPPLICAAQKLHDAGESKVTAVFGYRDEKFADEIVAPYVDSLLSIDNEHGNVVTLLDGYRVADLRAAADDEGRGRMGRQAWPRLPVEHGAAYGLRLRHLRAVHHRHRGWQTQGLLRWPGFLS